MTNDTETTLTEIKSVISSLESDAPAIEARAVDDWHRYDIALALLCLGLGLTLGAIAMRLFSIHP